MSFLFPGFLFALSAIAIPILIHLFNFRKFKKVYFSNVRFLKEIELKTSSSKNIQKWLILAARILAIIFLVLAFAKPFIPDKAQNASSDRNVVSLFIDNSYSMETVNKEGSLLDEAKRRAKEIAAAYGVNDKFQLLTNDFEAKHQRLYTYEDFISAIDEVKISGSNRTLPQIIRRQEDIFTSEPNSGKAIYVISDFQQNMFDKSTVQSEKNIPVRLIRVQANQLANVSIDSVWFASPIHKPGETEKLIVQLRNNSDEAVNNVPIKLNVNGQQKAIGSLNLQARAAVTDTLSFSGMQAGWQQGEIQITDYPVIFDDRFFFAFNVKRSLPVLTIYESKLNPYLQAVYRSDPFFILQNNSSGNINYASLGSYSLIIMDEVTSISSGLSQQLKTYVQNGGNILVFPSLTADLNPLKSFLQALGTDIPEQVVNQEVKVSSINLKHPLFDGVFEKVPERLDLPAAKKHLKYSTQSRTNRQNILGLPGNKMFMGQYRLGKGSIYLSAVPLDEEVSNLARHSVFVPIMYQAAMLSLKDSRLSYTVGKDQWLEVSKLNLGTNQSLKLRKENFEVIPDVQQNENDTRLYIADQIRDTGNYSLMKGDSLIAITAFNDNRLESDMTYADDNLLRSSFPNEKIEILNTKQASIQNEIKAINYGFQLWKVCIVLALVFLAAEILLIRFFKIRDPKPVSV